MYGNTIVTIAMVTAAPLRRTMAAMARVNTAATAISAAVPAMMRSSVGHRTESTERPRW
jgi:hypothetical protein